MTGIKNILKSESGIALALALMVLMVLAILSIAVVKTTNIGQFFSADYKSYQQRIYLSDSGADFGYGLIERAIANDQTVSADDLAEANVTIDTTDSDSDGISDLDDEIMGATVDSDNTLDQATDPTPNVQLSVAGNTVNIDIDYVKSKMMAGSSSEFSARYEGIGSGSSGGVGIYYRIDSNVVSSSTGKQSTIRINYKCVEGGGRCL